MEERQTLRQATNLWQEAYRYQLEGASWTVRSRSPAPRGCSSASSTERTAVKANSETRC
jgi:hypothetical protein